ncbi:MAG: universal stress protein [Proteocatella sp.]
MYKKILLAVDASEHSMRLTKEAIKIALLCKDSEIELIFVADFSKAKNEVLHSLDKEELELSRRTKLMPFEEQLKTNNLKYKIKILHGDPGPVIAQYANQEKIDLVVIGSKGLNAIQEIVLGSVSHKVLKKVSCPVLIVK